MCNNIFAWGLPRTSGRPRDANKPLESSLLWRGKIRLGSIGRLKRNENAIANLAFNLALSIVLAATGAYAGSAESILLESVSIQLFLEKSGTFSRDITTITDFHSWNFVPSG